MDNEIIQAYLWHDVIRLGFSPSGKKNIKKWLTIFGKSLKEFWEVDDFPPHPKCNASITSELTCASSLNMLLNYDIVNISKYSIRFLYGLQNREVMWVHDVDGAYFSFPNSSFLIKYNKRKEAVKKIKENNIKKVLDGLIFHPKAHQHIESPINNHQIRIGGGIDNPFLNLFHLRYQLCPIKKQEAEIIRLVDLFEINIKNNNKITANDLMKCPQ